MKIPFFGIEISRTKAVTSVTAQGSLAAPPTRGWFRILESFTGAWQQNFDVSVANVSANPTLFACVTLIASTVAKMRMRLVQEIGEPGSDIWKVIRVPAFSPVLRKPNHYQTNQQFYEYWVLSKLQAGNTYVLKIRDNRGLVTAMHVLDPNRVTPLIAPNSEVFYQLGRDDLAELPDASGYTVPASEIIHDRWHCEFHQLVGLSPIYAGGVAAVQGLNIQNNSTNFFGNGSRPGGILTTAHEISQATADRIKESFDTNYSGSNMGKIAVLGGGLDYKPVAMSAVDSELIEQLKWTDEKIAGVFHVPLFLVASGTYPPYNSVASIMTQFYSICIQELAEGIEHCLDEGLGLNTGDVAALRYGTEFNIDDLVRLDPSALMETLEKGRSYLTPNEGRQRLNLPPTDGGDQVYRQHQDYSLPAIAKRDAKDDPFAKESAPSSLPAAPTESEAKWMKSLESDLRTQLGLEAGTDEA